MSQKILLSGTSNQALAGKLSKEVKLKLGDVAIQIFSDSEIYVKINENIKNKNVFILQSGSPHPNKYLMELLILVNAARGMEPRKITALLPFYPYRRQERTVKKGESVTAELVAKLLQASGVNNVIAVELHTPLIEKFFDIPVRHLRTQNLFSEYFKKKFKDLSNFVVASPDLGAKEESLQLAQALKIKHIKLTKKRTSPDEVTIKKMVGDVQGKNIIILDDEINTGSTIIKASTKLKACGSQDIYVAATHGLFSNNALIKINKSDIKEVVVTDTIRQENKSKKLKIISIAKLLSKSI